MSIYMNIHPNEGWKYLSVRYRPMGEGSCILFRLEDGEGNVHDIALHYCYESLGPEFIAMLKKEIGELPDLKTDEVKGGGYE